MKHLLQASLVILILCIFSAGCQKETELPDDGLNAAVAVTLTNERYGTETRQVADVYLPANRGSQTKVMIIMHGGSWAQGDKADLNEVITAIRAQWPGLAIVNMNYRLGNGLPANFHPVQMHDIDKLIDYVALKQPMWKTGGSYALAGVSAGGHLAGLYAYDFDIKKRIKALVTVVGPTNLSDPFYTTNPLFQLIAVNYLGKTWSEDEALHRSVSPALKVTPNSPPTFMAYGALDPIVPLSNATTLRNNLQASGVIHQYEEYPLEGHDLSLTAINNVISKLIPFLKTHLP